MDFPGTIAAIGQALGVVKAIRDIDKQYDGALLKSQMADLYSTLSDVKIALADARDEIHDRDQKIRALEKKLSELASGESCPICNIGVLKVTAVREHPHFGFAGVQERTLKCSDCKHAEQRMHDPNGVTKGRGR